MDKTLAIADEIKELLVRRAMTDVRWKHDKNSTLFLERFKITPEEVEKEAQRRKAAQGINPQFAAVGVLQKQIRREPPGRFQTLISSFCANFLQFCFRREQLKTTTENALTRLYARAGLAEPLYVWCESPVQFDALPICAMWAAHRRKSGANWRRELAKTREQALLQRGDEFASRFWTQVEQITEACTNLDWFGEVIGPYIMDQMRRRLFTDLEDCLDEQIDPANKQWTELLLRQQINWPMETIRNAYSVSQWNNGTDARVRPVMVTIVKAIKDSLAEHDWDELHATIVRRNLIRRGIGAWELSWILNAAVPQEFTKAELDRAAGVPAKPGADQRLLLPQPLADEYNDWLSLLKGGFIYGMFSKVCFICEYPWDVSFNERLRLHNENHHAVKFADGFDIYAWHGTVVPRDMFQAKEKLTVESIDKEINAEVRRIKIELFGWEKYLAKDAELIHQDEFGKLYRKETGTREIIMAVQVTNSTPENDGSFKRYMLRVPPNMTTARQAVAWTFGMSEKEYAPDLES